MKTKILREYSWITLMLLFFMGFFNLSAYAASATNSLYTIDTSVAADPAPQADKTVVKKANIKINSQFLNGISAPKQPGADQANSFVLDLFGQSLTVNINRVESISRDSVSIYGLIGNDIANSVSLVKSGNVLQGNIAYKGRNYQIRYQPNTSSSGTAGDQSTAGANHVLKEIDFSKMPNEHPPVKLPDGGGLKDRQKQLDQANGIAGDSASVIDVMVVYTPSARAAAGGTTAMNALVDLAVSESNTGYTNSGVSPKLRLVYKGEITYTETGFSNALNQITATNDGKMDNVHSLRDSYGADVVSLLINDSSSCGLGWLNSSATTAFSVAHYSCATGYYSFAHEIGHNQGAHHDHATDTDSGYNHGYVDSTASWRTIMAYRTCTNGGNCTRLNYWSNPDKYYNGRRMGVPAGTTRAADNRRKLNETAYYVANFRQQKIPYAPGAATLISPQGPIATATPTYRWYAVSGATSYYLWVDDSTGNRIQSGWYSAAALGCASSSICSLTPTTTVKGNSYWWVKTSNAGGQGPWSAAKNFNASAPTTPTTYSPSGATYTRTPTYSWAALPNATWYRIYVIDSTGAVKVNTWYTPTQTNCAAGTGTCSYNPNVSLALGNATWWVQGYNALGYGAWSTAKAFTVALPAAPILRSPTGSITTTSPTYSWNKAPGATWYYLWVYDSVGGTTRHKVWYTAAQVNCSSIFSSVCSIKPTTVLPYGTGILGLKDYKWQVQSYAPSGSSAWSTPLSFTLKKQSILLDQ